MEITLDLYLLGTYFMEITKQIGSYIIRLNLIQFHIFFLFGLRNIQNFNTIRVGHF